MPRIAAENLLTDGICFRNFLDSLQGAEECFTDFLAHIFTLLLYTYTQEMGLTFIYRLKACPLAFDLTFEIFS